MATPLEVAEAHQSRSTAVTDKAIRSALKMWAAMDLADLDDSWDSNVGPAVLATAQQAQVRVASLSTGYVNSYARASGDSASEYVTNATVFSGIDGSGRSLGGLLHGSVTSTKEAIGSGLDGHQALHAGQMYLAAMMKTALHDMGRSADLTAAAGKKYTKYVRVCAPGCCSRCAILSGIYTSAETFQRHPACKCTSAPVSVEGKAPEGFFSSPEEYFDSLSREEQDKVFTKAGAEAVRSGADIQQIVTVRRGSTGIQYGHAIGKQAHENAGRRLLPSVIGKNPDGSPIHGYVTSEGTTKRGQFGKASIKLGTPGYARLMPETIVSLTSDPELRTVLLRDAGYLNLPGSSVSPERLTLAARDRAVATKFYCSLGVQLGG